MFFYHLCFAGEGNGPRPRQEAGAWIQTCSGVQEEHQLPDEEQEQQVRPPLHHCHHYHCRRQLFLARYNNMQVNPDGSLAANQTNESNHNTAKVRMTFGSA